MLIGSDQIAQYLPQRPPFIMVDELLAVDHRYIRTRLTIRSDNLFLEEDTFPAHALIEHLAQSAAAGITFQHLAKVPATSSPSKLEGFLVGLSRLEVFDLPRVTNTIETRLELLHRFGNLVQLQGSIFLNQTQLLRGTLKVAGQRSA